MHMKKNNFFASLFWGFWGITFGSMNVPVFWIESSYFELFFEVGVSKRNFLENTVMRFVIRKVLG